MLVFFSSSNSFLLGKIVQVRRFSEQVNVTTCELIYEDQEMAIVREIETGRYFRVKINLIEYPDEPQIHGIYEISFAPILPNASLMITYAMNGLRWNSRYHLQTFANGQIRFQMLADIINTSPLKYEFNNTDLMSGDLNVVFNRGKSSSLIVSPTILSQSESNVDYNSVYVFSRINTSLILEPFSIVTVPILTPTIQIQTWFTYNLLFSLPNTMVSSAFSIVSGKHKFRRLFQLSNSSSFLPAGHLLLYDSTSHVLAGEWNLPTLIESEKYEFELGQDPDVMLIYNRTISFNRITNSSLVTTHVLIQNYKQRRVLIRFKSSCQIIMNCLFYDDKARSLGPRLRYNLSLEAKSEVAFNYTAVRM